MVLRHLRFVLLLGLFVPLPAAAAVTLREVPVRLYDTTGMAGPVRASALETARITLDGANVPIRWMDCASGQAVPRCTTVTDAGERVLRIVRAGGPRSTGTSGVAALHSPGSPLPLGDAFVDLAAGSGVLATVYLDRVTDLAQAAGSSAAILLGYAIAHEIGHLLLGTKTHSTRGLMRPVWSRDEVRRGRAADWMFSESDMTAIRARLESMRALVP